MKVRPYKGFDKRACRDAGTNKKFIRTKLNRVVRQKSRLVLRLVLAGESYDENNFLVGGIWAE